MAREERDIKRMTETITTAAVFIAFVVVGGTFFWLTRGLSTYGNMTIRNVGLESVPDGTYTGSFKGGRWSNTVKVTVKNHTITDIKIVKDVQFKNAKTASRLISMVLKAQSLEIDGVTGATVPSKAYLKAMENALNGAL